jgi:hypothetical protein
MTDAAIDPGAAGDHVHDFRVVEVDFEGGVSTQELRCEGCDEVSFR